MRPPPCPGELPSILSDAAEQATRGDDLRLGDGTSVVGSGAGERRPCTQTRVASTITMTIRIAKNAASTPSTVELVTTACMSSMILAGGSTLPASIASWNLSRWAKKPSFGSSQKTFC